MATVHVGLVSNARSSVSSPGRWRVAKSSYTVRRHHGTYLWQASLTYAFICRRYLRHQHNHLRKETGLDVRGCKLVACGGCQPSVRKLGAKANAVGVVVALAHLHRRSPRVINQPKTESTEISTPQKHKISIPDRRETILATAHPREGHPVDGRSGAGLTDERDVANV
ncbi:hypothetical protein BJV74DRAFT_401772 [Russula compacta]|nr:hypothetical protein BJV74DRAFT_401772 [Russula compacta]